MLFGPQDLKHGPLFVRGLEWCCNGFVRMLSCGRILADHTGPTYLGDRRGSSSELRRTRQCRLRHTRKSEKACAEDTSRAVQRWQSKTKDQKMMSIASAVEH